MKLIMRRLDAFLILLSAVVAKGAADPVRTAVFGIAVIFILGWALDLVMMARTRRERHRHERWRADLEEADRRFAHLMQIMEDFGR